jgi:choline dehydrogenase-like flavoprotein
MNFRSHVPYGIGIGNDLVGRFFNDHPGAPPPLGEMIFTGAPAAETQFFTANPAFLAEQGVLPMLMRINWQIRKPLPLGKELARSLQCTLPFADRLTDAVLGDSLQCDTGGLQDWWLSRDPDGNPWGRVVTNAEAALNRDSRVTLSDELDAFGMHRVRLDWQVSPVDDKSFRETTLAFAAWLAEQDIGRMRIYDWVLSETPIAAGSAQSESMSSWHHMCTTRMSADPALGVVDADCKMHGLSNLYIGGSSVFASAGFANPTYTIVQLALRLGDHLAETIPAIPAAVPAPAEAPAPAPANP